MTPLRLALFGLASLAFASGCALAIDTDPQPTPVVKYGPDARVAINHGVQGGQHICSHREGTRSWGNRKN